MENQDFLLSKSSRAWLKSALDNFDVFLVDHAACERKASAMCMSFVVRYPDRRRLVDIMIRLAREELEHFHEVFKLLENRGLRLGADTKDEYVNSLVAQSRTGKEERLLDRLIIASIVEARGCERFFMISQSLEDPALAKFYQDLAKSEHRHHIFFLDIAKDLFPKLDVDARCKELLNFEAALIDRLPHTGILH